MAESADILRAPHQIVILPDLNAGCSMADMAQTDDVHEAGATLERLGLHSVTPVTYMNSTAELKAFCESITTRKAPLADAWAGYDSVRVLTAAMEANKFAGWVSV